MKNVRGKTDGIAGRDDGFEDNYRVSKTSRAKICEFVRHKSEVPSVVSGDFGVTTTDW